MNLRESTGIALSALRAQKLRSFLTLLGVIIGVSSVIAVMSLVEGLNQYVSKQLTSSGSNVFTVDRVGVVLDRLTLMDRLKRPYITSAMAARVAANAPHVAFAVPERSTSVTLRRRGHSLGNVQLTGAGAGYMQVEDYPVARGRPLGESDEMAHGATCVIGADVVDELFGNLDPLGQDLRVGTQDFTVVGVGEHKGASFGQSQDLYAIIPLATFQRLQGRVGSVDIRVRSSTPANLELAQDETRAILRAARHLRPGEDDDFEIVTPEMLLNLWHDISAQIFIVIVGVTLISLVVGGIVIMNIMLVSVTERTREIGVRKALGARRRDILFQFLIEAATLSSVGGMIGLALGVSFALLVGVISPLPVHVSLLSVVLGLFMATLVGVFFGAYPATRAARLDPIDALRYE